MKEREEFSNLEALKEEYKKLKESYSLPGFSELNKSFDIEEIDVESDFLLRKIRRVIVDKIGSYLRFIEIILNPSNAPMFFFNLIKKLDEDDKEILTELYEKLGKVEVGVIRLDLEYDESDEAVFVSKAYKIFNEDIKPKFLEVVDKLSNGEHKKKAAEAKSSYCG